MTFNEKPNHPPESALFLTFTVNKQIYGIAIQSVIEINREFKITPIPQTPDYVMGFVNLRGRVVPIIDLKRRFELGAAARLKQTCIVVIHGKESPLGIWVDSVCEVVDIPTASINNAPTIGVGENEQVITGMTQIEGQAVILLDLTQILSPELSIQLPQAGQKVA